MSTIIPESILPRPPTIQIKVFNHDTDLIQFLDNNKIEYLLDKQGDLIIFPHCEEVDLDGTIVIAHYLPQPIAQNSYRYRFHAHAAEHQIRNNDGSSFTIFSAKDGTQLPSYWRPPNDPTTQALFGDIDKPFVSITIMKYNYKNQPRWKMFIFNHQIKWNDKGFLYINSTEYYTGYHPPTRFLNKKIQNFKAAIRAVIKKSKEKRKNFAYFYERLKPRTSTQ